MNNRITATIAGLGVTQIIGWGSTYYLLTIMAQPIADDIGLAPETVAFGHSILLILTGVLGPVAGRMMDVRGARPVMASGSVLAAAGLVLLSMARGPGSYLVAWALMGVSGTMILYPAAFTALTQIDPVNARRNITLLTLPGGLASTVFWPLGTWLLGWMGWRDVCLCYAALNVLVCLPLHVLVARSCGGKADPTQNEQPQVDGLPEEARPTAFLLFSAVLALNALVIVGLLNQMITMLSSVGHPADVALRIGMIFGMSQVSARIVEGLFRGRYDALYTGLVSCGLLVAAMLILPVSSQVPGAGYVFAILLGGSNGLISIVRGALVLSLFGSQGYGQNIGSVAVAQGFTSAIAPVIFVAVLTRLGPMNAVGFCVLASVAALAAMAMLVRHAKAYANPEYGKQER